MSRYINVDAIEYHEVFEGDEFVRVAYGDDIDELSITDVVKVVRCKDCKYVGTDATCCLVCCRDGMGLKPYHVYHDDYCSYGEREEQ